MDASALPVELSGRAAVLIEDEAGALLSATGLHRLPGDQAVEVDVGVVSGRPRRVRFVAYADRTLAPLSPPDEATLESSRLVLADPTTGALPPPDWIGAAEIDGGVARLAAERPDRATPVLTASWVAPCPMIATAEQPFADSTCNGFFCATKWSQSGCALDVDLGKCTPGRLEGSVQRTGAVRLEAPGSGCTRTSTTRGARLALSCGAGELACRIDLFTRPFPRGLIAETIRVLEVPPRPTDAFDRRGYLAGVVPFADRVLVATYDGEYEDTSCHLSERAPGRAMLLDPDTMQVTGTATLPPCLTHLARDPARDEAVAIWRTRSDRFVGRLDSRARLLRSRRIDSSLLDSSRPVGLAVAAATGRFAIAFTADLRDDPQLLLLFDLDSLALISTATVGRSAVHLTAGEAGGFLLSDRQPDDSVLWLDADGVPFRTLELSSHCGSGSKRIVSASADPANGATLVASSGAEGKVFFVSGSGSSRCERAVFFEASAEPYAFHPWPHRPGTVLVGVTAGGAGTRRAYAALLDLSVPGFLPGAVEIGAGLVEAGGLDERGRVWLSLPWSGEVARVSPAP